MHGYLYSTTRTASFVLVLSIFTYNYVSRRNNTLALFTHAHTPTRTGGRLTSGKVDRSSFRSVLVIPCVCLSLQLAFQSFVPLMHFSFPYLVFCLFFLRLVVSFLSYVCLRVLCFNVLLRRFQALSGFDNPVFLSLLTSFLFKVSLHSFTSVLLFC